MHPDILRALENERRAELLRSYEFRQSSVGRRPRADRPTSSWVRRARRVVGVALVVTGERLLLADSPPNIDLLEGGR